MESKVFNEAMRGSILVALHTNEATRSVFSGA